jgi:hypothetical protein
MFKGNSSSEGVMTFTCMLLWFSLSFSLPFFSSSTTLAFLSLGRFCTNKARALSPLTYIAPLFIGEKEDVPAPVFKVVVLELLLSL